MAVNKLKVMEVAQKYVEKGQIEKAIKEYLKIVQEDPKDVRIWLKIGDLHAKRNAKAEATDTYLKVAQFYGEQGFYLKAVAVYKQILRLDPRLIEVNLKLAEVYRQLGLLSDALQQYELVAAFYHREGRTKEALQTIRDLVDLDPENVATRIKLAELYSKETMTREAIAEFAKAADFLRAHNRTDDFIKVAERLVWHDPDNHAMNRELAGLYLKRSDPRHALQKLQACFKHDPQDVDTLALLASAFLALDQKQKTVSVWKELARIHGENGQHAQALDVHRRILSVAPDDAEAIAALGGRRAPVPAAAPAPVVPVAQAVAVPVAAPVAAAMGASRVATPLTTQTGRLRVAEPILPDVSEPFGAEDSIRLDLVDDEASVSSPEPHHLEVELDVDEIPGNEDGLLGGAAEQHADEISKILTETDVYVKYGLHQKAIDHLRRVFELDPSSLEAREKLKDIYVTLGRRNEAISELGRLVEMTGPSGGEAVAGYLRELARLEMAAGGTAVAAGKLAARFHMPAPALSHAVSGDASSDGEAVLELELEEVSSSGLSRSDGTIEVDASQVSELELDPDDVDNDLGLEDPALLGQTTGGQPAPVLRARNVGPWDGTSPGEQTFDAALDELEGFDSEPAREFALDPGDDALTESLGPRDAMGGSVESAARRAGATAPTPGASGQGTSLEDDLDEAEFFAAQNLFTEARIVLTELLTRHPNHPLVMAKLEDLKTQRRAARTSDPAIRMARSAPPVEQSSPGAPAKRPTVIAKPLGDEDADTHYDLGLAYKEMGLYEEAMKEFLLVRDTPGRAVQCYLMIGLCHAERGKFTEAVAEFKSGLYVDGITDREALAIYFEIGAAYQALNDAREALYYYGKVHKRDPSFREVDRRIEALKAGGAGKGNGAAEHDDLDAADALDVELALPDEPGEDFTTG